MTLIRLMLLVALCSCTPKKSESALKVVNGRPLTDAEFPSVVKVSIDLGAGVNASCTSSIISDTVMITASHCLVLDNGTAAASASAILGGDKKIDGGAVHLHPQYNNSTAAHDIAFVKFPAGSFSGYKPMALSKKIPAKGDAIKIIGFGKYDHFDENSGGKKRIGFSEVEAVNEAVNFRGIAKPSDQSGKNAMNSQGDSGGPMVDANDEIIGISSTVDAIDAEDGKRTGHYTSIHDRIIVPFINEFLQGTLPENTNPSTVQQVQPGPPVNAEKPGTIVANPETGTPGTLIPISISVGACVCAVRANRYGTGCTVTRAGKVVLEAQGPSSCESADECAAAWQRELSGICNSFGMEK